MHILVLSIAWLMSLIIIGAIWSALDRSYGVRLRAWFYNMTNENPIDASRVTGFIHKRKASARFTVACVLAVTQSALVVVLGLGTSLAEFYSVFLEVPALMAGFYLGPWLAEFWSRRESLLGFVDELEAKSMILPKQDTSSATRNESTKLEVDVDADTLELPDAEFGKDMMDKYLQGNRRSTREH